MATWFSDDGTLAPESAFARWAKDINEAGEKLNRPLSVADKFKQWYEEIGFVDVQEKVYKIPASGWPADPHWKEIGQLWQRNLLEGLSGFSLGLFSKAFDWTQEQIDVSVKKQLKQACANGP
jgi:metalloendopeptidase OMA1, mitochondrial